MPLQSRVFEGAEGSQSHRSRRRRSARFDTRMFHRALHLLLSIPWSVKTKTFSVTLRSDQTVLCSVEGTHCNTHNLGSDAISRKNADFMELGMANN